MSTRPHPGASRRAFVKAGLSAAAIPAVLPPRLQAAANGRSGASQTPVLPEGAAPKALETAWFPDRVHAFVWRNWPLVPVARMARTIGATPSQIRAVGQSMGLGDPPTITPDQERRSYITVIKHNWHLLPYDQLLVLLGWDAGKLAYTLREDDFLYVKLGNLKPKCPRLTYTAPTAAAQERARQIASIVAREFPGGHAPASEPLFQFVRDLSRSGDAAEVRPATGDGIRFCYSYFALYGDPLLEPGADPYPEGLLARLAASGVTGVWLQGVLYKLVPFPWNPSLSENWKRRLSGLKSLVTRARRHGIRVYLYLNEPRAMPLSFFDAHPELKGTTEGDHATLCTSHPEVQHYLRDAVATLTREVPGLGGFFTITASENLTNCWSHNGGMGCPRCSRRVPSEVIAEVNRLVAEGIRKGMGGRDPGGPAVIAWDWGWNDAWAPEVIRGLPPEAFLQSVSEWSLPIERGGIRTEVGEYSISSVGPGPRASKHWRVARDRGLRTLAKIQAGNTWELSAVPYIPAVENVARHVARIREAGVGGLMLGWTLGGYPSPNLEVATRLASDRNLTPEGAMAAVADRRFGPRLAPDVVAAWKAWSVAFSEFPYHGGVVYSAPLQVGPANPLWDRPTGYGASMVGFPYDNLDGWRAVYPAEIFIAQLERVASGFEQGIARLRDALVRLTADDAPHQAAVLRELGVADAAAIHFRSVANQSRFVLDRNHLAGLRTAAEAGPVLQSLESTLRSELALARRLHAIQTADSRIGFEASNQYFYVPLDLVEKVLNCHDLLDRWLPAERAARNRK